MKSFFTTILALVFSVNCFSQKKIYYKDKTGKVFSTIKFDSITRANLGKPISIYSIQVQSDTVYRLFEIGAKPNKTDFAKRFEDQPLPNLQLTSVAGKKFETQDFKGKAMMINFWSTTCGPCIKEIPQLNELKRKFENDVVFIAIAPEESSEIIKLLESHPFEFTLAANALNVFKEYAINGYPKNLFIGRDGVVVKTNEGTPFHKNSSNDTWEVSVFDDYSKIISSLIR